MIMQLLVIYNQCSISKSFIQNQSVRLVNQFEVIWNRFKAANLLGGQNCFMRVMDRIGLGVNYVDLGLSA